MRIKFHGIFSTGAKFFNGLHVLKPPYTYVKSFCIYSFFALKFQYIINLLREKTSSSDLSLGKGLVKKAGRKKLELSAPVILAK